MLELAGRIQNSYSGLAQPDAAPVMVTGAPAAPDPPGVKLVVTPEHGLNRPKGVELEASTDALLLASRAQAPK